MPLYMGYPIYWKLDASHQYTQIYQHESIFCIVNRYMACSVVMNSNQYHRYVIFYINRIICYNHPTLFHIPRKCDFYYYTNLII